MGAPYLGNLIKPIEGRRIKGILPSAKDELKLAKGLDYQVLLKWGDEIADGVTFGFNNDFTAFIPLNSAGTDGLLWVNHEYTDPLFVSGYPGEGERTLEQVQAEQYSVGGSIVRVRQGANGRWEVVKNDPHNRRITAQTEIPFNWDSPIRGATSAIGTLANCSGGITPWGTILTAEENFDQFYGIRNPKTDEIIRTGYDIGWRDFFEYPPEHYGWVVEVDPKTGDAQKHVALGRCSHECATVVELPDGRLVVYTGDDAVNEHLYKFIGSVPGSLSEGTLYVANTYIGKWISMDWNSSKTLQKFFKDQTDVLIRLRQAAKLIGATPLDRPEDIDIDPITGHVLVALTNNTSTENYFGSILKIKEDDDSHASLTFKPERFLAGGPETGFACPDNMAFDPRGNLWFTSDISGSLMNRPPYLEFMNNGLFVVPRSGPQEGIVIQVASAPSDAELTGPWFAPDGRTLFLSVQHPGETTQTMDALTSHWPDGGEEIPRPAVVAIQGKLLDEVMMA